MTNEVDLAMELSKSENKVAKLQQRLDGLIFEAVPFMEATVGLLAAIGSDDQMSATQIVKKLVSWRSDLTVQLLLNVYDPVIPGHTPFNPLLLKHISPSHLFAENCGRLIQNGKLTEAEFEAFFEAIKAEAKELRERWDTLARQNGCLTHMEIFQQQAESFAALLAETIEARVTKEKSHENEGPKVH